jgi:replication factor C subunit 2/4
MLCGVAQTFPSLVEISDGDLRKAITTMQMAYRLVAKDELMLPAHVAEVAGVVPPHVISGLIKACKDNQFKFIQVHVCLLCFHNICAARAVLQ